MSARDKVTSLNFNNRVRFIYDKYCIAGVEYEDTEKNQDCSEEDQEDKDYTESGNFENEYADEDLEAEKDINKDELVYLEEDILCDD